MPVRKKQSKTKRILSIFNPRSFKGGMALFVLLFALGGGYYVYRSFALTAPPIELSGSFTLSNAKDTNGKPVAITCLRGMAITGYGALAVCQQQDHEGHPNSGRMGTYSPVTNTFIPNTGWLKWYVANPPLPRPESCKNNDSKLYSPNFTLITNFGPISYGQIYRIKSYSSSGVKWQVRWANRSVITGNCTTTSEWLDVKPL